MLPSRGVSTAHRTRTSFGRLVTYLTHAKFTVDAIMAKPCRAACDSVVMAHHLDLPTSG